MEGQTAQNEGPSGDVDENKGKQVLVSVARCQARVLACMSHQLLRTACPDE